jgi:putative transcriptional regulator
MTQKELAELVGVSRQTINAIENCKHAPSIDVAIRIADLFREAVDTVFEYDYEGKPEFFIVCVGIAGDRDLTEADYDDLVASLPSEAL